jgi:hypothetical protein
VSDLASEQVSDLASEQALAQVLDLAQVSD